MQHEKSCGAIVYRKFHGNIELLLIKNQNGGHWSFPKGHVEEGETEEQTAVREIMEETGISRESSRNALNVSGRLFRKPGSALSFISGTRSSGLTKRWRRYGTERPCALQEAVPC